jgi:nitrate reductase delta subunit
MSSLRDPGRTLRALAALLSYPEEALVEALPEIRECVPQTLFPLVKELERQDLLTSQERYVALFDRSRALSLHLFEHVHGESRDRGQAMVDLQAMYAARGFEMAAGELPDFVPAFLEYLSLLESKEAGKLLAEAAEVMRALGDRLAERGSRYASVFGALLEMAREPGLTKEVLGRLDLSEDLAALEKSWMDPEVTFGPQAGQDAGVAPVRLYRKGLPA